MPIKQSVAQSDLSLMPADFWPKLNKVINEYPNLNNEFKALLKEHKWTNKMLRPYWRKIDKASINAMPDKFKKDNDRLLYQYLSQKITKNELNKKWKKIKSHDIFFPDFSTLITAFKTHWRFHNTIKYPKNITRRIKHEYDHYKKAKQLGYKPEIGAKIVKLDKNRYKIYTLIYLKSKTQYKKNKENLTKELKDVKLIAQAPEKPSFSDQFKSKIKL